MVNFGGQITKSFDVSRQAKLTLLEVQQKIFQNLGLWAYKEGRVPAFIPVIGFTITYEPGAEYISRQYSQYPFPDGKIAANSGSMQPRRISLILRTVFNDSLTVMPASVGDGGLNLNKMLGSYTLMPIKILAAVTLLNQHMNDGGWFYIFTPAFTYTNALLEKMTDISAASGTEQLGTILKLDFFCPIVRTDGIREVLGDTASRLDGSGVISPL